MLSNRAFEACARWPYQNSRASRDNSASLHTDYQKDVLQLVHIWPKLLGYMSQTARQLSARGLGAWKIYD